MGKLKRREHKKSKYRSSSKHHHRSRSNIISTPPLTRSISSKNMYQSSSHKTSIANIRKHSDSGSMNNNSNNVPIDVFEAYKKKLKLKKQRRTKSMNTNGVQTILSIEKERITKDKFSRLFHDFESKKFQINNSER